MRKDYLTVSKEAAAEIEEKKSRFIATVRPVSSEQGSAGLHKQTENEVLGCYTQCLCVLHLCGKHSAEVQR